MISRERRNNYGLSTNVDVSPESTSQSNPSIANNIIINSNNKNAETDKDDKNDKNIVIENPYPNIDSLQNNNFKSVMPSAFNLIERNVDINKNEQETIESKLLEIYTDILLSNNKKLLANITSKQSIILSKYDLECIIGFITNLSCKIILVPDDVSCLVKVSPIKPISSIKIIDGKNNYDFQTIYNSTYNELCDKYKLNLSYCVD